RSVWLGSSREGGRSRRRERRSRGRSFGHPEGDGRVQGWRRVRFLQAHRVRRGARRYRLSRRVPRPTPEAVAEKAAQLRRFRRLALRTLLRSAGIGGVIGAFVGLRIRRSSPTVPTVVALGAGFLAGALLVCLLTGPT